MKGPRLFAGVCLIVCACAPSLACAATGVPQAEAGAKSSQESPAQFKQAATKFLQEAQAYLGIAALQWQNFMMVPRAGAVSEISANNAEYKAKIAAQFNDLMSIPGGSEVISSKLKDYYAAWGQAFDSMRPTAVDGSRGFSARTNADMQRMDAMAARIKMDL